MLAARGKKEEGVLVTEVRKQARVIAVTSGKGGVGKTNIVANLAYILTKRKKKSLILDADLGLANIDVILGLMPREGDLDLAGLAIPKADLAELLRIDRDAWRAEVTDIDRGFGQFGDRLPGRLRKQLLELGRRLA